MLVNEDNEPRQETKLMEEVQDMLTDKPKINFNAFTGHGTPRTLRMQGYIHNIPVQILIDGGSTHNFIQPILMQKLQLVVELSTIFNIMVAMHKTWSVHDQ